MEGSAQWCNYYGLNPVENVSYLIYIRLHGFFPKTFPTKGTPGLSCNQ